MTTQTNNSTATYRLARGRASAFTLLEVMVSMAIVLVLIVGVNQVFKVAADTVGTGNAISSKTRDSRAAHAIFYNEVSHMVTGETPFLIIDSRTQAAFRDARDEQSDIDYAAAATPAARQAAILTRDMDGDNAEGNATVLGERISPAAVDERAHRVDTLSFFARDLYRRQTGNPDVYIANMSSNEAWITYGHGRIFNQTGNIDNDADYIAPGVGTPALNPKNFYSTDWMLMRMAVLLVTPQPPPLSPPGTFPTYIPDRTTPVPVSQYFWAVPSAAAALQYNRLLPLGSSTTAAANGVAAAPAVIISDARFDIAGTERRRAFRQTLSNYLTELAAGTAGYFDDWWNVLPSSPEAAFSPGRFRCNPYPFKPIDSRKASQTASIMLGNCTQFVVEYAGDFVTQDDVPGAATRGNVTALNFDNTTDFYYDPTGTRHVRWYGFPRDSSGDGVIPGCAAAGVTNNQMPDVVPLRDVRRTFAPADIGAPFEHIEYTGASGAVNTLPVKANYADPAAGVTTADRYVCAWGPNDNNKPKMLRIIMRVDDPNGRLLEGQTSEYVINLP